MVIGHGETLQRTRPESNRILTASQLAQRGVLPTFRVASLSDFAQEQLAITGVAEGIANWDSSDYVRSRD